MTSDNVAYQQFNLDDYEVVRNVTLPFLILSETEPNYIKFNTAIEPDKTTFSERVRRSRKDEGDGSKKVEPMHIAEVVNLKTGEVARLVCHDVLESTLTEAYKDAGYVGKAFKIEKTKATGKRYFNFTIRELQPKQKSDAAPAKGSAKR